MNNGACVSDQGLCRAYVGLSSFWTYLLHPLPQRQYVYYPYSLRFDVLTVSSLNVYSVLTRSAAYITLFARITSQYSPKYHLNYDPWHPVSPL